VQSVAETVIVRTVTLCIYVTILVLTIHNTIRYIIFKRRYKEFSICIFYIFAYLLIISRVLQYTINFTTMLMSQAIKDFIVVSDGCSVCIGLS